MASLAVLPTELVVFIIGNFDNIHDLASLARTDRHFYGLVNPLLYKLAVEQDGSRPLAWAAHSGARGTLTKALEAGVDPNHIFYDSRSKDAWKQASTVTKTYVVENDDLDPWNSDRGSESDHNIDWTPDTTDSDRAGTSNQPSSDSSRSHQFIDSYENSRSELRSEFRSEYRSEFRSEYSDDEMMDVYDDADDADMGLNPAAESFGFPVATAVEDTLPPLRRFSALHLAARGGHTEIIDLLLSHGAAINASSEHFCDCGRMYGLLNAAECPEYEPTPPSWSPLHVAICHSRVDAAKLLLSRGASYMMDVSGNSAITQLPGSGPTALHHAAGKGLVELVNYLASERIQTDIDVLDAKTLSPFYYAYANRRWNSTIPLLLSLGANINLDTKMFLPYSTITPLGECCRLGTWEEAERLLECGADFTRGYIATGSGRGLSPLHMCCLPSARIYGQALEPRIFEDEDRGARRGKTISNLIGRGADLNAFDCAGDTPLVHAAQSHVVGGLRILLANGSNVHSRNPVGRTALMQAVLGPPNPVDTDFHHFDEALAQILQSLLDAGARIDETDADGNTVLHLVFKANTKEQVRHDAQLSTLRLLLNKPGSQSLLQVRNSSNCTPLQLAFQARNHEACDILLRRGYSSGALAHHELLEMFQFALTDPDIASRNKALNLVLDLDVDRVLTSDATLFTRLLAESGRLAVVAAGVIATRGLPPLGARDYTGLLCQAIEAGDFTLAYSIVEAGADVNAASSDGYTPLVLLLLRDSGKETPESRISRQFLQALLERNASIHLQSPHVRPLTKAIVEGWASVVSAMLKRNPLKDDPMAAGGCYLHDAVTIMRGVRPFPNEKIIENLIASGASLTELNHEGDTPLSVLLKSICEERSYAWRYHRFIRLLHGPDVDINRKNIVGISAADYLHKLLSSASADRFQTDLLAQRIRLVDCGSGMREMKFVAPQGQIRPVAI